MSWDKVFRWKGSDNALAQITGNRAKLNHATVRCNLQCSGRATFKFVVKILEQGSILPTTLSGFGLIPEIQTATSVPGASNNNKGCLISSHNLGKTPRIAHAKRWAQEPPGEMISFAKNDEVTFLVDMARRTFSYFVNDKKIPVVAFSHFPDKVYFSASSNTPLEVKLVEAVSDAPVVPEVVPKPLAAGAPPGGNVANPYAKPGAAAPPGVPPAAGAPTPGAPVVPATPPTGTPVPAPCENTATTPDGSPATLGTAPGIPAGMRPAVTVTQRPILPIRRPPPPRMYPGPGPYMGRPPFMGGGPPYGMPGPMGGPYGMPRGPYGGPMGPQSGMQGMYGVNGRGPGFDHGMGDMGMDGMGNEFEPLPPLGLEGDLESNDAKRQKLA